MFCKCNHSNASRVLCRLVLVPLTFSRSLFLFVLLRNIQVENPVAVLDQEEAKKFLTGKAEDKYNFFMKATELERVDRTFAATVDHVQELRDSQEKIKDTLQLNVEQVEILKKKWEAHQQMDKLEDKVSEMKVKLAWKLYNTVDEEYTNSADVCICSETNLSVSITNLVLTFLSFYLFNFFTGYEQFPRKGGEKTARTLAGRRGCEWA
jgi:hypothetical protein